MQRLARQYRALIAMSAFVCSVVPGVKACPACFGATDSRMGAGMDAGVSLLIGVIAFVLAGVAGTGLFWIHRSRRFSAPDDAPPDTPS